MDNQWNFRGGREREIKMPKILKGRGWFT